jgi:hypothetical protein
MVRHISKGWVATDDLSYAELFMNLLTSIYDRFEEHLDDPNAVPRIPDPMLNNNVAFNWQRSHFEGFMAGVKQACNWAQRALTMDDEQTEEAVALWQKVFDNTFPTTDQVRAKEYADARKMGNIYVTPQGRVLNSVPAAVPAIHSPAHRFFGEDSSS